MIIEPLPDGAGYWTAVRAKALALDSDGCTGSILGSLHTEACYEHDVHYRTAHWIGGEPITRREADVVMRWRCQQGSQFGAASPVAWVRWAAVRAFGWWPWRNHRRGK